LAADAALLSRDERSAIEAVTERLASLTNGTDHRAIKQALEALNRATEDFAARRMDASVRRALTGKKIGSL